MNEDKKLLFQFFTNCPSNNIIDCKEHGDFEELDYKSGLQLIDHLIKDQVQFTVKEVPSFCLIDLSFDYWEIEKPQKNTEPTCAEDKLKELAEGDEIDTSIF